jgi:hypothetical protein
MNDVQPYRDYLDKEMTIMGVLAGFCVTAAGLMVKTFAEKDDVHTAVWYCWRHFLVLTCAMLVVAAAAFFYERTHLAWCNGRLALKQIDPGWGGDTIEDQLHELDGWGTWIPYRIGFGALITAGIYVAMAALQVPEGTWTEATPVAVMAVVYFIWMFILASYPLKAEPLAEAWKRIRSALG